MAEEVRTAQPAGTKLDEQLAAAIAQAAQRQASADGFEAVKQALYDGASPIPHHVTTEPHTWFKLADSPEARANVEVRRLLQNSAARLLNLHDYLMSVRERVTRANAAGEGEAKGQEDGAAGADVEEGAGPLLQKRYGEAVAWLRPFGGVARLRSALIGLDHFGASAIQRAVRPVALLLADSVYGEAGADGQSVDDHDTSAMTLFQRFKTVRDFHEELATLQRLLVTPSEDDNKGIPNADRMSGYLERSIMAKSVAYVRTAMLVWEIRYDMQRTRVQTLDAYRKYSLVLHGVHDAIRDLVDRAREQAEMADELHKSVKGQVQERLKTINELKQEATGLYDARFTTLTDQVKKLGKAQAVAQEIVVLDNQMLDSAVCGCILIPKSGLRRVLYMGCCVLVFISLLFALPQITW